MTAHSNFARIGLSNFLPFFIQIINGANLILRRMVDWKPTVYASIHVHARLISVYASIHVHVLRYQLLPNIANAIKKKSIRKGFP